ncbi:hypothetical protein MTR_6g061090 [Medicago truncatula]|uniref:Uncharacterized protein n=1 Tax=Medicago truncatula TaxID=3880 RepID=A0A072UKV8_MEDTR|nr:hypothetical protein MTR_6g061090 [Medicago truncatula]
MTSSEAKAHQKRVHQKLYITRSYSSSEDAIWSFKQAVYWIQPRLRKRKTKGKKSLALVLEHRKSLALVLERRKSLACVLEHL